MIIKLEFIDIRTGEDAPDRVYNKQVDETRIYREIRDKYESSKKRQSSVLKMKPYDPRECPASRMALIEETPKQTLKAMGYNSRECTPSLLSKVKSLQGHLRQGNHKDGIRPKKGKKSQGNPQGSASKPIPTPARKCFKDNRKVLNASKALKGSHQ